jgi:hypothetical protein
MLKRIPDIVRYTLIGLSNKEIADELNLSEITINRDKCSSDFKNALKEEEENRNLRTSLSPAERFDALVARFLTTLEDAVDSARTQEELLSHLGELKNLKAVINDDNMTRELSVVRVPEMLGVEQFNETIKNLPARFSQGGRKPEAPTGPRPTPRAKEISAQTRILENDFGGSFDSIDDEFKEWDGDG